MNQNNSNTLSLAILIAITTSVGVFICALLIILVIGVIVLYQKLSRRRFNDVDLQLQALADNHCPTPPPFFTHLDSLENCFHTQERVNNKDNDIISLRIPEGAIPDGMNVTIDISVALYGPFQYPQGLRPVSPVFWICVRGQQPFYFEKPVIITMQHCLSVGSRDESNGLVFLKSNHTLDDTRQYKLSETTNKQEFSIANSSGVGIFHTNHFCGLCICCKDISTTTNKIKYSIIQVRPQLTHYSDQDILVYFCFTLSLLHCRNILEKYYSDTLDSSIYKISHTDFHFKNWCQRPALCIRNQGRDFCRCELRTESYVHPCKVVSIINHAG